MLSAYTLSDVAAVAAKSFCQIVIISERDKSRRRN